jgi:hypothetical protein
LTAFVLGTLQMLNSVWSRVLPAIFAEAAEDHDVADTVKRYWGWRRGAISGIVERGKERGEVRPEADPEVVLEAVDGPLLVRLLVTGKPLDMAFADGLVEHVMNALSAHGLRGPAAKISPAASPAPPPPHPRTLTPGPSRA